MSAAAKAKGIPPRMVPASIAARITIWIWAVYAIWQGARIIDGGPQRWGSASFDILRLAPNPTVFWGTALIVLGFILGTASVLRIFWLKAVGCAGIAVWSLCFAYGALTAARENPQIANTGLPTYAAIAVSIIVLIFVDESRPPPTNRLDG